MKYFKNVHTLEELRKQYKELLKKYHPDNANGSTEATQEINAEYDRLFKLLKDKHERKSDNTADSTIQISQNIARTCMTGKMIKLYVKHYRKSSTLME